MVAQQLSPKRSASNAGSPDAHTDLDRLRRGVISEASDCWITKKGSSELIKAYSAIEDAVADIKIAASDFHVEPSTVDTDLAPLRKAFGDYSQTVTAASDLEYAAQAEWHATHPDQDWHAVQTNTPHEARSYRASRLVDQVTELERWLDSTAGRALQRGLYFLDGVAGSGKTHLLLEATQWALQAGRPAVFLKSHEPEGPVLLRSRFSPASSLRPDPSDTNEARR